MGFDGYSFCKPHSASYTLVAYKSAYLRAHYPAEFMAAVLSNGGGYYSTLSYISEARRMGLRVLPPHINESETRYAGKGDRIRMGFVQLKGLSQEAKEAIIHERNRNGPFDSFQAFLERTGPHLHLKDVKVLIKGGCFDPLHGVPRRAELMWEGMAFFDGRDTTQPAGLFDHPVSSCPRPGAHTYPYPRSLLLKQEMESFGFVLSVHPLALYDHVLKTIPHVRAADLGDHIGKRVTTVGRRVTGKRVRTKTGDPMTFITFEDVSGTYETVFFPEVYHKFCHLLNTIRPYVLKGSLGMTFNAITLTVEAVRVV